jgi:membrane protein
MAGRHTIFQCGQFSTRSSTWLLQQFITATLGTARQWNTVCLTPQGKGEKVKRFVVSGWTVLKKTVSNFLDEDSFSYASSIAFSTIFSLPAILIIALAIAATFYERNVVQEELVRQVGWLIGQESAKEIENIIVNARFDATSTFAKIMGVVTLAVSATAIFLSLQSSLNKIFGIKPKPQRGWLKLIINRLISLAMVISLGFVFLVSLLVDTVVVVFQDLISRYMQDVTLYVVNAMNLVISLAFIAFIFGMIFKVLPDAQIRWREVWVGAVLTAVLFTGGKYLIGFYLGNSSFNSAYGAAGSLVIILVWVYYSTIIVLFGAEFTSVYAKERGAEIQPYSNAVKIQIVEVEKS